LAEIIPDTLDFAAYARETEARAKVRKASAFTDDLLAEFKPVQTSGRKPQMFSTKLRDRLIFRPGEVTVWAGYNGHRKSMFTGQVGLDLCVSGERVLVASFEMSPARTMARMARQAFAHQSPKPELLERFGRWTDGRLWLWDHIGRVSPDQCIAVVRYFAEELQGTQVFIDSMMMVCASEESMDEQKQFSTDIVRAAQEYGVHIHLIAHCRKPQAGEDKPPTKYDLRGSAAISDQAHNVCMVWANKAKKDKQEEGVYDLQLGEQPDALLSVEKQRNGPFEGKLKLWFSEASFRFSDSRSEPVEPYALELPQC
jgi:twinkle protein